MNFELLSRNTMILIDELLKNQSLLKLIEYNSPRPLSEPEISKVGSLVMRKIIPTPFTGGVPEEEETNLRVFFPDGDLQNRVVLDSEIDFQIIIHKNLWAITKSDESKALRPYEIMSEIIKTFEDKTIKTLGVIHFKRFRYQHINKDYGLYHLEAVMTTL